MADDAGELDERAAQPATKLIRLPTAAVRAAQDAGLEARFLGDYVGVVSEAAERGRRLDSDQMADYRLLGRAAAEHGAQLRSLVDLYLSVTWRVWPELPAVADAQGVEELRAAGLSVLRAVDDAIAALCEGYGAARAAAARAEEALRREFVDDLLTGGSDVGALLERAAAFGLRLEAPHVVLVAAGSRRFVDGRAVVRDVEARLRAAAGGLTDLLVATKEGLLVCVIPDSAGTNDGAQAPSPAALAAQVVADRLGRERGLAWRLGVSRVRTGGAGIRAGFDEARGALDLAERLALEERTVRADHLLVYRVLLRDREPLEELVTSTLAPLSRARGGPAVLVDTLDVYFAEAGIAAAAARRLHLSVRALTYRLERIHELTELDPADAADRYTLQTAVLGARLLRWTGQPGRGVDRARAKAARPRSDRSRIGTAARLPLKVSEHAYR